MRNRFILISTLVSLVPVLMLLFYVRIYIERINQDSLKAQVQREVSLTYDAIEELLNERRQTVNLLSEISFLKLALEFNRYDGLKEYFDRLVLKNEVFENILIFNSSGRLFFAARNNYTTSQLDLSKITTNEKNNALIIPQVDRGVLGIRICKPIFDSNKKVLGFIVARVAPQSIKQIVVNLESRLKSFGVVGLEVGFGDMTTNKSFQYTEQTSTRLGVTLPALQVHFSKFYKAVRIRDFTAIMFGTVFILVLVYFFAFNKMSQVALMPLQKILEAMVKQSSGDAVKVNFASKVPELEALETHANSVFEQVASYRRQEQEMLQTKALAEMASQVAHDIRSPLVALDVALSDVTHVPEDTRVLMRGAMQRIREIAQNLLERYKNPESLTPQAPVLGSHLVSASLDSIISEVRLQYRHDPKIKINFESAAGDYGLFAIFEISQFKRVISNVINNAVDAVTDNGRIDVSLSQTDQNHIVIQVRDYGCGIPASLISKLGQSGVSFGKNKGQGGAGIGLNHAFTTIKAWGGNIDISSQEAEGTTVKIILPKSNPPAWFAPQINIESGYQVVVVDDDAAIHGIWKKRFEAINVKLTHFTKMADVLSWGQQNSADLYLVDYESIGEDITGLETIMKLNIVDNAVLVTSRYDDAALQARCIQLGLALLPKQLAPYVLIHQRPSSHIRLA